MGFLERRPGLFGRRPADRYRPVSRSRGGNPDPVAIGRRGGRPELTELLGRTVLEARTQQICQQYGLIPRGGTALARSYLARSAGVEIAADAHGVVTAVFLHFHGDDGFASYCGEIPGGGGWVARREALWAALGRPGASGDPYREKFLGDYGPWDRWLMPGLVLHAQYALDGESLHRITLTAPDVGR